MATSYNRLWKKLIDKGMSKTDLRVAAGMSTCSATSATSSIMCRTHRPTVRARLMDSAENQIVVYQPNETMRLDVRLENETVWLTQAQIASLFGTKRPAITKHLSNIYNSGELEREDTCSILEHMGNDGKQSYRTMFYNLDAILAVGYRVNSRNATLFRRWSTQVIKSYLLKGYAVNVRLNQMEDKVDLGFEDAGFVPMTANEIDKNFLFVNCVMVST